MPTWTSDQQKAINNHGKNIIVSAGAGSGKTAVLSARVLETIKRGVNIDDLLILTFTNAAAKEMKDRIRNNLKKYPELKEQYEHVDVSYITTFDAFALSLVKRYNQLLNISDNITIIDPSIISLKKSEYLTNILEKYYEANNPLFNKLINDFCLKDDQEIVNAIMYFNDKLDNKSDKNTYLTNYLTNNYNTKYLNDLINEYIHIILTNIKTLQNKVTNLSNYVDNKYLNKLNAYLADLFSANDYTQIRLKVYSLVRLPSLPSNSLEEAKAIKGSIKDTLDDLKKLCQYNDLKEMQAAILNTKDYVAIIIEIILKLDEQIMTFKHDNNAYEFIDIANMAIKILKEHADVRNDLKNKYYEIMIDEYQDTNDIQDLFISLIANNNVYMVGDIKQSIYGFRNANPYLFKEKYDSYADGIYGERIDLKANFRSRLEVINGINLIFNSIMDDEIGGADYFSDHQMNYGNKSYDLIKGDNYNLEILNYEIPDDKKFKPKEIEIFTIAQDIKNKIVNHYQIMDKEKSIAKTVNYRDFVILIDRSKDFDLYKKIFEYLNIPITIMRDQTITDSLDIAIIKNIYNIIMAIYNNNFDTLFSYSFVSVARSFLFSLSDNDILTIINNRSYASTSIYEICYQLAKQLPELNNQELYEKIINDFAFYQKIITIGNVKDHLVTLDAIDKIVAATNSLGFTPLEFRDYLDAVSASALDINLSLNKDDSNSVKIMTIHASKGLEYPICYFSGLSELFNTQELKAKFSYDNKYGIVMPYLDLKTNSLKNTITKTLLKNKYLKATIAEHIRLFYVALTRARDKMIFVTNLKDNLTSYKINGVVDNDTRLNYQSFNDILSSLKPYLKPYIKEIDLKVLHLTKDYNLSKYTDFHTNLKIGNKVVVHDDLKIISTLTSEEHYAKATHKLFSLTDKNNMLIGKNMHYLFEITDFNNPDYAKMNETEQKLIANFIKTGIFKEANHIYKEYEFMTYEDNELKHGIIDLLIIFSDQAKIIDYKLKNMQDEAYLNQLNGYKQYIEKITKLPTKIYLYSIVDSKLTEL
jgi:ATP-dependent helicase/nuclease subunit A